MVASRVAKEMSRRYASCVHIEKVNCKASNVRNRIIIVLTVEKYLDLGTLETFLLSMTGPILFCPIVIKVKERKHSAWHVGDTSPPTVMFQNNY